VCLVSGYEPDNEVSPGQQRKARGERPVYDSERVGGQLGQPLSDGLSAWKRGVRRPGWETLLERVKAGESDGIVVWHTDRPRSTWRTSRWPRGWPG